VIFLKSREAIEQKKIRESGKKVIAGVTNVKRE